jgi:hypothetical protein
MAETQDATVGYMGEFHLYNGSILYELVEVQSFKIPEPGSREQVETTHLKSPGWRRTHVSTFYEDSDFEVTLNSRVLSSTDTLLSAALAADDVRAFKAVIPENGVPVANVSGTCRVIGYDRGTVEKDGVITATVTLRVVSISAAAAGS